MFPKLSSDKTTLRGIYLLPKSPLLGVTPLLDPLCFPALPPYSPHDFSRDYSLIYRFHMNFCVSESASKESKRKTIKSTIITAIITTATLSWAPTVLNQRILVKILDPLLICYLIWDMLLSLSYLSFLLCKTWKIISLSRILSACFYVGVGWRLGPWFEKRSGQCLVCSELAVK